MAEYLQHFNLSRNPFDKNIQTLWQSEQLNILEKRFQWLTESPGIGLLTGGAGVGKTAALRKLCNNLNPHSYKVIYNCETDFGRVDLYRQFASDLGLEPAYRRAIVWRAIKERIEQLVVTQCQLPIWIIDEAQNLPNEFFRDFPSFVNFAFDSKPLMTVWFVGHNGLEQLLSRANYAALHSRISVFMEFQPITDPEQYQHMIHETFKGVGATSTLISSPACEILRLASRGMFRVTGEIVNTALRLAAESNLNHLPDDIIQQAIKELRV
jgi:MSHA biogenesis protein MshM